MAQSSTSEANTSVTKVSSAASPRGEHGEKYLASGITVAMRLWENETPGAPKPETAQPYETVGYVIGGKAELQIEGQTVVLQPGDSYVINKGERHRYTILEPFTAVEATSPPAQAHGRDAR